MIGNIVIQSKDIMEPLHTNKRLLSILFILFCVVFVGLGVLTLIECPSPFAHALDLLLHDRIVQLVMVDFAFFFLWVYFWIIDQSRATKRNPIPWFIVGLIAATIMIYAFVLSGQKRQKHLERME
jgi:uncharacterized BrkB/YihY/UPF0761 family membrane protein